MWRSSTAVYESERLGRDRIRGMKATGSASVALCRGTATPPVENRAVRLATIAKIAVIPFQIPVLSQFWTAVVGKKTVECGLSLLGVRIGSRQELRKIVCNFSNVGAVVPVEVVDRQRVFKPKKAMNVTCEDRHGECAK
jgi:hypothetical protein